MHFLICIVEFVAQAGVHLRELGAIYYIRFLLRSPLLLSQSSSFLLFVVCCRYYCFVGVFSVLVVAVAMFVRVVIVVPLSVGPIAIRVDRVVFCCLVVCVRSSGCCCCCSCRWSCRCL